MDDIVLRKAMLQDREMLYQWRNAEETRHYSFNSHLIDKREHVEWFEKSLESKDSCLLIAEYQNKPVGVLRYDILNKEAKVSIYLKPGLAGRGFGTAILKLGNFWLKEHKTQVAKIIAAIFSDNVACKKAFEKAGFALDYFIYSKIL